MSAHPFAAQLLRASTDGFAGIAASRLFEADPSIAERHGSGAFESWRAHLRTQLEHLAAAAADGLPEAFAERLAWSQSAFVARDMPVGDLAAALGALRAVLEEELPGAAWSPLADYFELAAARLQASGKLATSLLDPETAHGKLARSYLIHVLTGEQVSAQSLVLEAVADGLAVREALLDVLVPALQEVGRMWHLNEISVGEEHFATRVTRRLMTRLVDGLPPAAPNGKTVVVAAAAGDAHEVGVELVCDLFHLEGWKSIGLGADVPASDIALAAERYAADLVVISATLDVQRAAVAEAIHVLRSGARHIPVLVGGGAFAGNGELWKSVGADGFAIRAADATARGAELVAERP